MAKLNEILEIESRRHSVDECRVINLFQEGTFYRAYEWSAWLCVRYIQQFKSTKRYFKNLEDCLVFVGFPVTSLQKYTPEKFETKINDDKSVLLLLPDDIFTEDTDVQLLGEAYSNWKQSVPFTESSKKELEQDKGGVNHNKPERLTDILHEVLAYPIEQKSPMDCMIFLAEVKKKIAQIL